MILIDWFIKNSHWIVRKLHSPKLTDNLIHVGGNRCNYCTCMSPCIHSFRIKTATLSYRTISGRDTNMKHRIWETTCFSGGYFPNVCFTNCPYNLVQVCVHPLTMNGNLYWWKWICLSKQKTREANRALALAVGIIHDAFVLAVHLLFFFFFLNIDPSTMNTVNYLALIYQTKWDQHENHVCRGMRRRLGHWGGFHVISVKCFYLTAVTVLDKLYVCSGVFVVRCGIIFQTHAFSVDQSYIVDWLKIAGSVTHRDSEGQCKEQRLPWAPVCV